jgi:hypothetical protein
VARRHTHERSFKQILITKFTTRLFRKARTRIAVIKLVINHYLISLITKRLTYREGNSTVNLIVSVVGDVELLTTQNFCYIIGKFRGLKQSSKSSS